MAIRISSQLHISNSTRLILAIFQLYAGIEREFGKAIINILKQQYPDQEITVTPSEVGNKMMAISKRELQRSDYDAQDAIQEFLTYLTTGSQFVRSEEVVDPETGEKTKERTKRTVAEPWNFTKDFQTWQEALRNIYTNLRHKSMSKSYGKTDRSKRERGIDQAFGVPSEEGGKKEGGEGRMPTGDDTALGKALDDKAAIKSFVNLIDEHIPDLTASLSPDTRALFDLIFNDNIGTFGSDIKENMNQASALKEKNPELYQKNAKRWSGFVGDLRGRLLDEIWSYIENEMSWRDYAKIKDYFFSRYSPEEIRRTEKQKEKSKFDYQRGIDERKYARFKWDEQAGTLSAEDKRSYDNLKKKLLKEGMTQAQLDAVEPIKRDKKDKKKDETTDAVASRIANLNLFF